MTGSARWGVVIVNYNSARFALDAALSALGDNADAHVVIVDNASTNNSIEIFENAARGNEHQRHTPSNPVAGHDINLATLNGSQIEIISEKVSSDKAVRLSIIKAAENGGFAAGCNIGLRFLEQTKTCSHYLLLNPDALVGAEAFSEFEKALSVNDAGLCGATVLLANQPGHVQAFGGACLNPLTLMGENLGQGELLLGAPSKAEIEARLSYPLGPAIALRRDYLDQVGYLDERYFLYYEEADWALAGRKRLKTVWAREAYVFHHYGVSSKSNFPKANQPSERSILAEYHMARSRLLFCLKWRPWLAPIIFAIGVAQCFTRLRRGRFKAARALAKGMSPGAGRIFNYST